LSINWQNSSNQHSSYFTRTFKATITADQLEKDYKELKQWSKVAKKYNVTHATIINARKHLGIFQKTTTAGCHYGGSNSKHYKGKYIDKRGYIRVNRYHPENNKQITTYEHILVMERHLNRSLKPGEIIHHLDGDKSNNNIENLWLCDHSSHRSLECQLHQIGYELLKTGLIQFDKTRN
jgi:hypothetical protein